MNKWEIKKNDEWFTNKIIENSKYYTYEKYLPAVALAVLENELTPLDPNPNPSPTLPWM